MGVWGVVRSCELRALSFEFFIIAALPPNYSCLLPTAYCGVATLSSTNCGFAA